jgi:hypothetical protein
MEMKSPITGTMTFEPSQIAFSFTNGRFARHEFTSQHQSHVQSERPHILIRNRKYIIKKMNGKERLKKIEK